MGETERLTVEIIPELQDKIATQYQIICSLDAMNDELQAKLGKIEQVVKEWENSKIVTNCYECAVQIRQILEQE